MRAVLPTFKTHTNTVRKNSGNVWQLAVKVCSLTKSTVTITTEITLFTIIT